MRSRASRYEESCERRGSRQTAIEPKRISKNDRASCLSPRPRERRPILRHQFSPEDHAPFVGCIPLPPSNVGTDSNYPPDPVHPARLGPLHGHGSTRPCESTGPFLSCVEARQPVNSFRKNLPDSRGGSSLFSCSKIGPVPWQLSYESRAVGRGAGFLDTVKRDTKSPTCGGLGLIHRFSSTTRGGKQPSCGRLGAGFALPGMRRLSSLPVEGPPFPGETRIR